MSSPSEEPALAGTISMYVVRNPGNAGEVVTLIPMGIEHSNSGPVVRALILDHRMQPPASGSNPLADWLGLTSAAGHDFIPWSRLQDLQAQGAVDRFPITTAR